MAYVGSVTKKNFLESPPTKGKDECQSIRRRLTQPTGRQYNRKQGAILEGKPQKGAVGNSSKASVNPPYSLLIYPRVE